MKICVLQNLQVNNSLHNVEVCVNMCMSHVNTFVHMCMSHEQNVTTDCNTESLGVRNNTWPTAVVISSNFVNIGFIK